jgi:hypothetical protein
MNDDTRDDAKANRTAEFGIALALGIKGTFRFAPEKTFPPVLIDAAACAAPRFIPSSFIHEKI